MPLALFDFDGTLIRHDSGVLCALPSIRRGLLGPRTAARLVATYVLNKAGRRTRADAQRAGFACYAGRTLPELRALMSELHHRHLRHYVSAPMRRCVADHRRRGDRLAILTASAYWFAEPLARELGIDDVIGSQVVFSAGRCTGIVDGAILDGVAKLDAARALAQERGERLDDATFYTDHIADLPLLEAVGSPIAVGPHRALARVARARGWKIVEHA